MKQVLVGPQPALVLVFPDVEQQVYLQSYPFLNGPRRDLNEALLARLPLAISVRNPASGCQVERHCAQELRLRPPVEERARSLLDSIGVPDRRIAGLMDRFAWKVSEIPADTRAILDIGCGDGIELAFLHAAAPDARITAIDWHDGLMAGIKNMSAVHFKALNILDYLEATTERFDLIFSNHVIEHMYDPDRVCALLQRCLAPGGTLLMALPLDGLVGSLWRVLANPKAFESPLGLGEFDLGHAWKTTPSDVRGTLLSAGFGSVRLVQRQGMLNAATAGEETELVRFEARGAALYNIVFGALRRAIGMVFGHRPPSWVVSLVYALERRVWFGGNNLKNTVAPEVLVRASP